MVAAMPPAAEPFAPMLRAPDRDLGRVLLAGVGDGTPPLLAALAVGDLIARADGVPEPVDPDELLAVYQPASTVAELRTAGGDHHAQEVCFAAGLAWAADRPCVAVEPVDVALLRAVSVSSVYVLMARAALGWLRLAADDPLGAEAAVADLAAVQRDHQDEWLVGDGRRVRGIRLISAFNHCAAVLALSRADDGAAIRHLGAARAAGDYLPVGDKGLSVLAGHLGAMVSYRSGLPAHAPAAGRR